jgi:thiol-disulfide isomerase/thioredoxin
MTDPQVPHQQKNSALLKATLITIVGAIVLACLFSFWRERTNPNRSAAQINQLDQMESQGIPELSAKSIDGQSVTTQGLRGKVVIINFWASWCEPCVAEVPSLVELVKAFPGQMALIAVSGDNSLADINAFLKSFPQMKDKDISIIFDEDHKIMAQYGTERLPESYVVGKDGKLIKKIVGSINWHTKDSEAFIKELLEQK